MRRRCLIALIGAALVQPPAAFSQARTWRIGWLSPRSAPPAGQTDPNVETFEKALAVLGYAEGRSYILESRYADADNSRLRGLAEELVADHVDIIVTIGTPTTVAAKAATPTIPIVMAGSADPVEHGLVASLARPGGNITGLTHSPGPEFAGKCLELLKEAAPGVGRVGILWDSSTLHEGLSLDMERAAAAKLGLVLLPHDVKDVRSVDDFAGVLAAIQKEGADALFVFPNFVNDKYARAIIAFAAANRMPSMFQDTQLVTIGGLMSYYTDWFKLRREAAVYVDKILRGAKPADLPVEEPTDFELAVNLKTAKALGLTIPPSILARASVAIE